MSQQTVVGAEAAGSPRGGCQKGSGAYGVDKTHRHPADLAGYQWYG